MTAKFSLQTFTIRKYIKTPQAIAGAFERIKDTGLNAVELARINFTEAEIDAVAAASARFGIDIGSTQITYDYLDKNRDWVLEFHDRLGCAYTAVSVLPTAAVIGSKRDKLLRFAEALDRLGRYYRERGLNLCFHHHDFEFRRYGDQLGLDLLLQNTAPEHLGLVLDTYWTQRGGKTPHDMIADLQGRVKVVHLRDYRIRWKFFELLPIDCEVGAGNLDFNRIIDSCCAGGVHYMAIEQATATPFESVAMSVKHLRSLGFQHLF
ncbi:sugar phosphate isomerase/epimerase [Exilibacterium tricleocarpae]|uniref:Sugar phosphate isomerase/epimerase n=1 Tax=Exilibacterium tricleocarpae TaxID=2591008 RepID=A0A545SQT3_9GAMM|nr:sugar phosphate isomerase/epimerase [Exilibacterium tricleocarpae]TQV67236.1 sugar phosphate isomerase/epimerase [Exilibacterium tricleocarpae]